MTARPRSAATARPAAGRSQGAASSRAGGGAAVRAAPRAAAGRGPANRHRAAGRRPAAVSSRRRFGWLRWLAKWTAVAAIWGFIVLAGTIAWFAYDMPEIDSMALPDRRPAMTVVAADGQPIARFGDLAGETVQAGQLPPHLVQAVIAIEDRRFHSHFGIDPIGLARAAWVNYRSGRVAQGGSTITQQLAKILFLTPERTLRRKVQEALLALWLETQFTKDQILTAYLNRVYLGAGTYGVDAAARTYFDRPAAEVDLYQAAILAGLLRAPSRYSPASNPDLAEARARTVLLAMADVGFIPREAVERPRQAVPMPTRRPGEPARIGRYFADWVADQVPGFVGPVGTDLTIRTTLDSRLQRIAERAVERHLVAEGATAGVSQAAVVMLDPDGAVLAMVGGRAYAGSQFNRATQARRQPGSAFKPIVYLAALQAGLRPGDTVLDAPLEIGTWSPGNFDGDYRGAVSVTEAFARSLNTPAVRVLQQAGIDRVRGLAQQLGIASPLSRDLSLALGTSEVTLLELTTAYAAIQREGRAVWPYAVTGIAGRDGSAPYRRSGDGPGEVVRRWHAAELTRMMVATIAHGTGRNAALDRPAAGKTGTSQRYRDAWFVGFTADYILGVWVGNDDGTPMHRVTGGGLPARIWRDIMTEASEGLPARPLPGLDWRDDADTPGLSVQPLLTGDPAAPAPSDEPPDTIEGLLERLLGAS